MRATMDECKCRRAEKMNGIRAFNECSRSTLNILHDSASGDLDASSEMNSAIEKYYHPKQGKLEVIKEAE